MARLISVILISFINLNVALIQAEDLSDDWINSLVVQLDSDSFMKRREAFRELLKCQPKHLTALIAYTNNSSSEVKSNLRKIISSIRKRPMLGTFISGDFTGNASEVLSALEAQSGSNLPKVTELTEIQSFKFNRLPFWLAIKQVLDSFNLVPSFNEKTGLTFVRRNLNAVMVEIIGPVMIIYFPAVNENEKTHFVILIEQNQKPVLDFNGEIRIDSFQTYKTIIGPLPVEAETYFLKKDSIVIKDSVVGYILTGTNISHFKNAQVDLYCNYRLSTYLKTKDDMFAFSVLFK